MTPEIEELNKVIKAVHEKGPDGEHMVGLTLRLPHMTKVNGQAWIDWKLDQEVFENVPIAEATARLKKTFGV